MSGPANPPSSRGALELSLRATTGRAHLPFLRRHLRRAHQLLSPPLRELSVALVGDKRMADVHEQYMNLPGPTDVLSFPLETDAKGRVISGEIVVCVPEARRQAGRRGTPMRHELLLYALHGLLHLCGYDDTTKAAYTKMHQTEDHLLTQLGVGPIFSAPPRRGRGPADSSGTIRCLST